MKGELLLNFILMTSYCEMNYFDIHVCTVKITDFDVSSEIFSIDIGWFSSNTNTKIWLHFHESAY